MSSSKQPSIAEQIDNYTQRVVAGVFMVSCIYALEVVEFFARADIASILDKVILVMSMMVLLLVFPGFVRLILLKRRHASACKEPEGFLKEIFTRATGKAFQFTFVFLVILGVASEHWLAAWPGELLIYLILAFTLAVFAIYFFILNHDSDQLDNDDISERTSL